MSETLGFDLNGKAVVITGAGRGIGKAIAHACANASADVVLGSRHPDECEQVAADSREYGVRASSATLDVRESESIRAFVNKGLDEFGRIDVLSTTLA